MKIDFYDRINSLADHRNFARYELLYREVVDCNTWTTNNPPGLTHNG
ncbi:MAG: hypothetical protein QW162_05435 [Ignisphaera sp.]